MCKLEVIVLIAHKSGSPIVATIYGLSTPAFASYGAAKIFSTPPDFKFVENEVDGIRCIVEYITDPVNGLNAAVHKKATVAKPVAKKAF
ncbi:CLUMA_CG012709, isoform A [Clunio marinus]|uniref:CLUMA_CG012709, isoform A n=1 Tax=Clunio marinus TaxID=568069 RepID=A0A1J1III7_9DIPT|nr:CLUMA_CG012709, isoform A [Clunio marinus]